MVLPNRMNGFNIVKSGGDINGFYFYPGLFLLNVKNNTPFYMISKKSFIF